MALDARFAVGAGSGALWMLLGIVVLVLARSWRARAYGTLAFAFGGQFVAANLAFSTEGADMAFIAAGIALYAVGGISAALLASQTPGRLATLPAAVVVAIVSLLADDAEIRASLARLGLSPDATELFVAVGQPFIYLALAFVAALLVGLALEARRSGTAATGMPWVAAAFGVYLAFNSAVNALQIAWGPYGPQVLASLAVAVAWLAAVPRAGRPARSAALAILAAGLAAAAAGTWISGSAVLGIGLARTVGAALFAFAVFRYDFLGIPLPRLVAHRGALAAGTLAVLFIVAQVAQEFLSASYGLLTGGIVAGAFLFAAHPVQRAIERMSDRAPAQTTPTRREELYRNALRVALKDRTLSRDEEIHLHRLAEELGIGAGRAHELLVEVEREARAKAP